MKLFKSLALAGAMLLALAIPSHAQTVSTSVSNLYTVGLTGNTGTGQHIAGTAMYARNVSTTAGTYAFTVLDVFPAGNGQVTTNIGTGVAQKLATIDGFDVFAPTSVSIAINGGNTGYAWGSGLAVPVRYKKTSYFIVPTLRFNKSSVGGDGYTLMPGIQFGWGN